MPGTAETAVARGAWLLPVATALLAAAASAGLTWWVMGGRLQVAEQQAHTLQQAVTRTQEELLGYSRYTSYLTLGKQALAEHTKLLTATVAPKGGTSATTSFKRVGD